jgi:hypothetical protein
VASVCETVHDCRGPQLNAAACQVDRGHRSCGTWPRLSDRVTGVNPAASRTGPRQLFCHSLCCIEYLGYRDYCQTETPVVVTARPPAEGATTVTERPTEKKTCSDYRWRLRWVLSASTRRRRVPLSSQTHRRRQSHRPSCRRVHRPQRRTWAPPRQHPRRCPRRQHRPPSRPTARMPGLGGGWWAAIGTPTHRAPCRSS